MKRIKIGVVGVGHMGKSHCLGVTKLQNAKLAGVYDISETACTEVAESYQTTAYTSYNALLAHVDAVILATPSTFHCDYLAKALLAGRDVFIEKPMVTSLDDVKRVSGWLRTTPSIVQVGHVERFNPAISTLFELVNQDEIVAIEARRCGLSDRSLDVDVVLDLMIHDLDIILSLVKSPISRITASQFTNGQLADLATAVITFDNGTVATLTASRLSHRPERNISVTEKNRTIVIDGARKDVFVYRSPEDGLQEHKKKFIQTTKDIIGVPHGDAVYEELSHFVKCVQTRTQPLVDGWAGLRSVEVAMKIRNQF